MFKFILISCGLVIVCIQPKNGFALLPDNSFCPTDIERLGTVVFLDEEEASRAILNEKYEPYFSQLQNREIHALTGEAPPAGDMNLSRQFAKEKFSSAVTSFLANEKSAINFVISEIQKILLANDLSLIARHSWKLIKIEDWLCGGFAHTRGEYIILSQRHLNKLIGNWNSDSPEIASMSLIKKLGGLLVHEQFHSLQRVYPEKFESLYTNEWGLQKVLVQPDSNIVLNQLTNPDAPKAEWAVNCDGKFYWIRTLIDPKVPIPIMGEHFVDVVFTLEKKNDKYFVAKDSNNNIIQQDLTSFSQYTAAFPVSKGLDHPNEISAYMFSKYLVALIEGIEPFEKVPQEARLYSNKYVSWLKNNFN